MPRQNLHATRVHILVPDQELAELSKLASRNGLTRSDILRRAITYFLKAVDEAKAHRNSESKTNG